MPPSVVLEPGVTEPLPPLPPQALHCIFCGSVNAFRKESARGFLIDVIVLFTTSTIPVVAALT